MAEVALAYSAALGSWGFGGFLSDKPGDEVKFIVTVHEIYRQDYRINYLVSTNKAVGLILNFAKDKVEVKRKVKDL